MRLTELRPRWLVNEPGRKLFIFLCPHCRNRWLSCKTFALDVGKQLELFAAAVKTEEIKTVVPMRQEVCWKLTGEASWDTITVSPSIDASPSGDWHGHIKHGGV